MGKLAERYRTEHLAVNCKPRTAAESDRLLRRTSPFFADKPVHAITKGDVLDLIQPSLRPIKASAGGRAEATSLLKAV